MAALAVAVAAAGGAGGPRIAPPQRQDHLVRVKFENHDWYRMAFMIFNAKVMTILLRL